MLDGVFHKNVSACIEGDSIFSLDDTTMYNILASFEGNVIAEDGAFVHDVLGLSDDGISFECALVRQSVLGICN